LLLHPLLLLLLRLIRLRLLLLLQIICCYRYGVASAASAFVRLRHLYFVWLRRLLVFASS
jgi:hypothetical protein